MNGEDKPRCVACDCDISVEHYDNDSLRLPLQGIRVREVYDFLQEMGLFYRI